MFDNYEDIECCNLLSSNEVMKYYTRFVYSLYKLLKTADDKHGETKKYLDVINKIMKKYFQFNKTGKDGTLFSLKCFFAYLIYKQFFINNSISKFLVCLLSNLLYVYFHKTN